MLAMHVRPGRLGQQDVPRHDHLLARRRPAAQTQHRAPIALVHHPVGHQRVILAMIHHRQIEHLRVFQRPAHHVVVLHAMTVIGDRHHAGLLERADRRQFLAREVLRDGPRDIDVHDALRRGPLVNQRHRPGVVNRRRRVGHANHRGESAARRRRSAGGDRLLGHLARLTQMDVQINQPRANHLPADVHPLGVGRRLGRRVRPDRGNLPLANQHIRTAIEAVGGINHPTAGEKQRIHAPAGYTLPLGVQAPSRPGIDIVPAAITIGTSELRV